MMEAASHGSLNSLAGGGYAGNAAGASGGEAGNVVPTAKEAGPRFLLNTRVLLRLFQWIFTLLSFALVASISIRRPSAYRYAITIAVLAWAAEWFFIANYITGMVRSRGFRIFEAIFTTIWAILLFAAATAVAAKHCPSVECGNWKAAIVFLYLAFALYVASAILAIIAVFRN